MLMVSSYVFDFTSILIWISWFFTKPYFVSPYDRWLSIWKKQTKYTHENYNYEQHRKKKQNI